MTKSCNAFALCTSLIVVIFLVGKPAEVGAQNRPSIVLINVDDADRDMFVPSVMKDRFPNIFSIASGGTTFTNFHITTPVCGPSRACLLRGQHAYALGIQVNARNRLSARGFAGDSMTFFRKGFYDDELGKWMKDAGYHTIFVGKFNNMMRDRIPKGWDDFYQSAGSEYYKTVRMTNRTKPQGGFEKLEENVYRTNAEADDVVQLIRKRSENLNPLFVYFAPFGPHTEGKAEGGMIDRQLKDLWPDIQQPISADWNESDFSDKPKGYEQVPLVNDKLKKFFATEYRERMIAMKSIDTAVGRIVNVLKETGRLKNTYIFFMSDNGYSLGQHRIAGKCSPFTRSAHVPLLVRGPGVPNSASRNDLLAHIDLAPTLLELARAKPKRFFDGKSFRSLLNPNAPQDERLWRESMLIENWQMVTFHGLALNTTYSQLRMYDAVYTEWADGSREYYDLSKDPFELENRFDQLTPVDVEKFGSRLRKHRRRVRAPMVTVETPWVEYGIVEGPPFRLAGVADHSSGIRSVKVSIQKSSDKSYWNGIDWQNKKVSLVAELENPKGIQCEWGVDFAPGSKVTLHDEFVVHPVVESVDGRINKLTKPRRFRFDSKPPTTHINNVRFLKNGLVRLVGHAFDDHKVKSVKVILRHKDNGEYYDGQNWSKEKSMVELKVDEDGLFKLDLANASKGSYVLRAIAKDETGNVDKSEAVRLFQVK